MHQETGRMGLEKCPRHPRKISYPQADIARLVVLLTGEIP